MCHRIGHRNHVGFRAKADLASGPAANDLERLTQWRNSDHGVAPLNAVWMIGPNDGTTCSRRFCVWFSKGSANWKEAKILLCRMIF
jgi:hypothetical protein